MFSIPLCDSFSFLRMQFSGVKGGVREARHISEAGYLKNSVKSCRKNLYISLFEADACSAKPF